MDHNRFLELLARKKSNELTLPEQKELMQMIERNPEYAGHADLVDELFKLPFNHTEDIDNTYIQQRWDSITKKINQRDQQQNLPEVAPKKIGWLRYMVVAASVAAIFLIVVLFYNNKGNYEEKQNVVSTRKGSKSKLMLPDGSLVWLNADSKIAYNKDFGTGNRSLSLSGEAYFDVVKDPAHPFIVKTATLTVKVVGTTFNVKAYGDDKHTETTLIKGMIEVTLDKDRDKKILLKPEEKLTVQNERQQPNSSAGEERVPIIAISQISKPANDSLAMEAQWVKNRLAFSNERLDNIALQVSRWYGVAVEISDPVLKSKKYSGLFFENDSLEQVMEALRLTGDFHYTITNQTITIVP